MPEESKEELKVEQYNPDDKEVKKREKWLKRFKTAEEYRSPYQDKWLRMHGLYRAFKEKSNYAYDTKLMPPIAFEIVETVKSRLASAKINVRILPRFKKDIESKSLESWDDKIKFDLDKTKFPEKKIDLINSALIFGDGVAMTVWGQGKGEEDNGGPHIGIQDLWLLYVDPEAINISEDSRYEIVQVFKTKEKLVEEEKERGENHIYENLKCVENEDVSSMDARKKRYEINTKKMGQIAKGDDGEGEVSEERMKEKKVELWQIWDHEKNKLMVLANRKVWIRDDDNPYMAINGGRIFVKLADHALLWELWSIGHIEPVETTIHEIADSRNQAMDDIVFNLDPIKKVRKGAHLVADDLITAPGAIWELQKSDDVVIDRPPDISKQWLEKDAILKKEIQTALAISEYAQGLPQSAQEPKGKVELLLMQTNIRFSILLKQFENTMIRIVNNMIELNKEFGTEDEGFRIVGDEEVDFKEFKKGDRETDVDSIVKIEPAKETTPDQRKAEVMNLYKIFVAEDKPNPEDPEEVERWKVRKRTFQKMILGEYDMEQYEDLILGEEEEAKRKEEKPEQGKGVSNEERIQAIKEKILPIPTEAQREAPREMPREPNREGIMQKMRGMMTKIPLLNKLVK